jgi:hypothetical protein
MAVVPARDVRWTNFVDRTTPDPEVAGVITTCNLVPAGTHRGKAIVNDLISLKSSGLRCELDWMVPVWFSPSRPTRAASWPSRR